MRNPELHLHAALLGCDLKFQQEGFRMTYTFYKHISGKNGLQLVLPTGDDFPKETTAADWIQTAVKDGKDVPQIVKDEVAKRVTGLPKWR
ncbi:hypothetical protein ACVOMV_06825 [Mesorhizobium atlanticum]